MTDEQALYRLAARHVPRFRQTFLNSVGRLRNRISLRAVEEDMALGLTNEPRHLLAILDGLEIAKAEDSVFAEIIAQSGAATLGRKELREAFTVQSPFVQQAARKLTTKLIRDVSNETKRAVRQLIFEAIRDGDAPRVVRDRLGRIVGLSTRDALAVARLEESLPPAALQRYADKALRRRGLLIARTETLRAGNLGRVEAWKAMERNRLIDTRRFRQVWMVTADDRLCPDCAPMDGMAVSLGGSFEQSERGVLPSAREPYAGATVEAPPLHPACRCTLVAEFA